MNITPSSILNPNSIGVVDVRFATDPFLIAGEKIGKKEGYASLGNAIRALSRLTDGAEAGAGFVRYENGRFQTANVLTTEFLRGPDTNFTPYHLGSTWKSERGIRFHDGILAVVDGAKILNQTPENSISKAALVRRELSHYTFTG